MGSKHDLRQLNNSHIVFDTGVICTENGVKTLLARNEEIHYLTHDIQTMYAVYGF